MIPATQRPDGTWRKPRKIRTGFNAGSGGAARYVPPAFRAAGTDGRGDERAVTDGPSSLYPTRSLHDVALSTGGCGGGGNSFLNAALFLLTATTAMPCHNSCKPTPSYKRTPPSSGEQSVSDCSVADCSVGSTKEDGYCNCVKANGKRQHQHQPQRVRRFSVSGAGMAEQEPACDINALERSVVRAAEDFLGCTRCHRLSPAAPARDATDNADLINSESSAYQSGASSCQQSSETDLWAKLWQVTSGSEQNQATSERGAGVELEGQGQEWIGFALSLRYSDLGHLDGQCSIVEFLERRVGVAREHGQRTEEQTGKPHLLDDDEGSVSTLETATAKLPLVTGGHGINNAPAELRNQTRNEQGVVDDKTTKQRERENDQEHHCNPAGSCEEREPEVLAAVLVFAAGLLSKRDRAELHRQAEKACGVSSASHGVGNARFLALACGLGHRAVEADLQLPAEKVALAQRLFRLAQQEYHSRYERMSHREIREVVAAGGPSRDDHPELFRLLQKDINEGVTVDRKEDADGIIQRVLRPSTNAAEDVDYDSSSRGVTLDDVDGRERIAEEAPHTDGET